MKVKITLFNKTILINTKEVVVIENIKKYCYKYLTNKENYNYVDWTVNISCNTKIYNNYKIQYLCNNKYNVDNILAVFHKDNMIIIKKEQRQMYIILSKIENGDIEQINRIIINLILKLLEEDKVFFIEASCISVGNRANVLLGELDFTKDIMLELLKGNYNYVSSEKIGFRIDNNSVKVINLPEKSRMRNDYCEKINTNTFLEKIIILENNVLSKETVQKLTTKKELYNILQDLHFKASSKNISYLDKIYGNKKVDIDYDYLYQNIKIYKISYNKKDNIKISNIVAKCINN